MSGEDVSSHCLSSKISNLPIRPNGKHKVQLAISYRCFYHKLCTQPQSQAFFTMSQNTSTLTIGRLARAANVGIETIRYYQRRELLPTPEASDSAFRTYPIELVERIRFIKRAQELGFSLEEVGMFLELEDGSNRDQIRKLAADRLTDIRAKITDLKRMEEALSSLVKQCEATGRSKPCPIIAAMADKKGELP